MLGEFMIIFLPGAIAAALHSSLFKITAKKHIYLLWLVYGCIINVCVYGLKWIWLREPLHFLGGNFSTNLEFALYGFVAALLSGVLPMSRYLLIKQSYGIGQIA